MIHSKNYATKSICKLNRADHQFFVPFHLIYNGSNLGSFEISFHVVLLSEYDGRSPQNFCLLSDKHSKGFYKIFRSLCLSTSFNIELKWSVFYSFLVREVLILCEKCLQRLIANKSIHDKYLENKALRVTREIGTSFV